MVSLLSSDDQMFVLSAEAAGMSTVVQAALSEDESGVVPLARVTGHVLAKVTEYCKAVSEAQQRGESREFIHDFEKSFMPADPLEIESLILAARFMGISRLYDLSCEAFAQFLKGKTPDEIRTALGIENDLSEKEQLAIKEDYARLFEGAA